MLHLTMLSSRTNNSIHLQSFVAGIESTNMLLILN
ncbi:hypothetical protein ES288_D01G267700v1 [Gossypium darwinii]|uniref:Uncharacterized protein n=1 Tax=Gossypium darwinii TaxID=34276 RepID=A0A5D2DUA4_GOSDA|nr:hypothetical protein ES288_D01G267700v1 [Gossypium darwinii]